MGDAIMFFIAFGLPVLFVLPIFFVDGKDKKR
jgi:hypothetical protein